MSGLIFGLRFGALLGLTVLAGKVSGQTVSSAINLPIQLVELVGAEGPLYLANVSIGTPPQNVTVQIDTGSADFWVFGNNLDCESAGGCEGSSFDPTASSTYESILAPGSFNVSYGSDNSAAGNWFKDDVQIGGVTVKSQRIGLALNSTGGTWPFYGILGLGLPEEEEIVSQLNASAMYPTTVMTMASQGLIDEPAFAVYLNDVDSLGSVLFGGVDTDKYSGPLKTFPVSKNGGSTYSQWYVNLTAVGLTTSNGTSWNGNSSLVGDAFIDSGSPKAFIPPEASEPIMGAVGASYNEDAETSIIACSAKNLTYTVDFVISGDDGSVLIQVPMHQLVDPLPGPNTPKINGQPACSFGVSPGPPGFMVLGDGFLRGAYAVFDVGNKTVSLAQAVLDAQ